MVVLMGLGRILWMGPNGPQTTKTDDNCQERNPLKP